MISDHHTADHSHHASGDDCKCRIVMGLLAYWATNIGIRTCILGNESQEFEPPWQQFGKDTAGKKIIIFAALLSIDKSTDDMMKNGISSAYLARPAGTWRRSVMCVIYFPVYNIMFVLELQVYCLLVCLLCMLFCCMSCVGCACCPELP